MGDLFLMENDNDRTITENDLLRVLLRAESIKHIIKSEIVIFMPDSYIKAMEELCNYPNAKPRTSLSGCPVFRTEATQPYVGVSI